MRLAVDVAGLILRGPADLEQRLLQVAALRREHDDRIRVDPVAEHRRDLLVPQDLFQDGAVARDQDQAVGRVRLQDEAAIAGHRVDDVDEQRLRHREP